MFGRSREKRERRVEACSAWILEKPLNAGQRALDQANLKHPTLIVAGVVFSYCPVPCR
jgi:hypothetical protein